MSIVRLENVIFQDNSVALIRTIIFYENHFIEFYQNQNDKVKIKIQYVFELIKLVERVAEKFLKHLEGTDRLFEIRVEYQSNMYKIFCCFDEGKLIVPFNGFQKKTQKLLRMKWKRQKN